MYIIPKPPYHCNVATPLVSKRCKACVWCDFDCPQSSHIFYTYFHSIAIGCSKVVCLRISTNGLDIIS